MGGPFSSEASHMESTRLVVLTRDPSVQVSLQQVGFKQLT